MSYTTVKAIWPGEKHENIEELRNAWGSAPIVWDALSQKYLGKRPFGYLTDAQDLWNLWKREDIPASHRAVLMLTFDRVYVTRDNFARMAADIKQYLADFPVNQEYVNHWPRLAELFQSNPDYPAIGLYCTSVSEDPFQGTWNEEREEYDAPDWAQCYDLYAELDERGGQNNG